jgi:hypothetical protein
MLITMLLAVGLGAVAQGAEGVVVNGLRGAFQKGETTTVFPLYPNEKTLCCKNYAAYVGYLKALQAGDEAGIKLLTSEGRAFPLEAGTKVVHPERAYFFQATVQQPATPRIF